MTDGYTHDPDAFDEDGERVTAGGHEADRGPTDDESTTGAESTSGATSAGSAASTASAHPSLADREFDWRGWTVVAGIFVAFLVIPGVIYLYPHVGPMFGLTFWDTYLALPMIPAVVLALLAVWATTRP